MGREILFCIDGREATEDEVNNLNPRDIKRIDFYTNGHTDYPKADVVFDYVLKERDYAGTVAVNGQHNLNKPLQVDARGTAQYFQGKSEFALSVADSYDCFSNYNSENYTETAYGFPDGTNVNTTQELPSQKNSNNLRSYFNYIYKDKKQSVYSSFRFESKTTERMMYGIVRHSAIPPKPILCKKTGIRPVCLRHCRFGMNVR